jgi:hypothetical protein
VAIEAAQLFAGRGVPQADGVVVGARQDAPSVRGEGHALDVARVPLEAAQLLAGFQVPQAHRQVLAARQRPLPVPGEGHAEDVVGVAIEAAQLFAGRGVPQAHGVIVGARQDAPSVRRESHAVIGFDGFLEARFHASGDAADQPTALDGLHEAPGAPADLEIVILPRGLAQRLVGGVADCLEGPGRGLAHVEVVVAQLPDQPGDQGG